MRIFVDNFKRDNFAYFFIKTYVVGAHLNHLGCCGCSLELLRLALMSTLNIGFYEDVTKINFQLSSNTRLISSSGNCEDVFSQRSSYGVLTSPGLQPGGPWGPKGLPGGGGGPQNPGRGNCGNDGKSPGFIIFTML